MHANASHATFSVRFGPDTSLGVFTLLIPFILSGAPNNTHAGTHSGILVHLIRLLFGDRHVQSRGGVALSVQLPGPQRKEVRQWVQETTSSRVVGFFYCVLCGCW